MSSGIPVARGQTDLAILPAMANRHGLIAGATGTGKTVTLQVLAESFSAQGVPVFMADVKGDLSAMSAAGQSSPRLEERLNTLGLRNFSYCPCPVILWDVFGQKGHPVRTTISEMGPLLLARLLELNQTQSAVLTAVFRIADDSGLLLLDLKDLRAMLQHVSEHARDYKSAYGNISPASTGAIQRGLLNLEQQGADKFFGEPALEIGDLMRCAPDGRGMINILSADRLMTSPVIYSTFLLWMLSELFEKLPEAGDPEKPRLVFFFDEAHLLFKEAPRALLDKIEQVVRLIRSKGVGVYLISQNPLDIPRDVLGQLGNRIQHALRAFTPQDQKSVKAAAQTFRSNPDLKVETVITELSVGEALVSFLDAKGSPSPVQRAMIFPPHSRIGTISEDERQTILKGSPFNGRYDLAIDRESAYEKLTSRTGRSASEESRTTAPEIGKTAGKLAGAFLQSAARAIGTQIGRQIFRGVLGSILGTSGRR